MLESSNVNQMTIMLLASIATAVALYAAFPQEIKSTPKLARKIISDKAPLTEASKEVPQGRLLERYDVKKRTLILCAGQHSLLQQCDHYFIFHAFKISYLSPLIYEISMEISKIRLHDINSLRLKFPSEGHANQVCVSSSIR